MSLKARVVETGWGAREAFNITKSCTAVFCCVKNLFNWTSPLFQIPVNFQCIVQGPPRFPIREPEGMVDFFRVIPQDAVEQTDRKRRHQPRIVVSRLELASVDLAAVKHNPLDQTAKNRQLHFDIVDRSRLIDRLDSDRLVRGSHRTR